MKTEHILITTDLSQDALRPYASVAELARSLGARITLLHVVPELPGTPHAAPFAPPLASPGLDERMAEARIELTEQRAALGDAAVELDVVVSRGDTAETIADYAARNRVDLIALSTHGRGGFRRLVLGSVAEGLLRRSSVPVLVFPHSEG